MLDIICDQNYTALWEVNRVLHRKELRSLIFYAWTMPDASKAAKGGIVGVGIRLVASKISPIEPESVASI